MKKEKQYSQYSSSSTPICLNGKRVKSVPSVPMGQKIELSQLPIALNQGLKKCPKGHFGTLRFDALTLDRALSALIDNEDSVRINFWRAPPEIRERALLVVAELIDSGNLEYDLPSD